LLVIVGAAAVFALGVARRSHAQATTCTVYQTGTDVQMSISGVAAESACNSQTSSSTSNAAWSYTQSGNTYSPSNASTVCSFTSGELTYSILDAGGQFYGQEDCQSMDPQESTAGQQSAPTPTTTQPAEPSSPSQSSSEASYLTTYAGQAFSVSYPADWAMQTAEARQSGGYTDTTIVGAGNSSLLIRVDVKEHAEYSNVVADARPIIASVQSQPGYRLISERTTTFDGLPAVRWEFLVDQSGVALHKVDLSVLTHNGAGVAILTQARATSWPHWKGHFAEIRNSLQVAIP
jgi:hypothetical protein